MVAVSVVYAPWCNIESFEDISYFQSMIMKAVASNILSNTNTLTIQGDMHILSQSLHDIFSFSYDGKVLTVPIESSTCVCLLPTNYCDVSQCELLVTKLRDIFSTVLYKETDGVNQFLDSRQIQIVPCIIVSWVAKVDASDTVCSYPLQTIIKQTQVPVSEQFTKSLELYNNFDMIGALRSFSYLLLDEPNHSGALFNIACILHMIGYPTLAIPYLQNVLLQDPTDSIAHSFLWALASNSDGFCLSSCMQCYRTLAESKINIEE